MDSLENNEQITQDPLALTLDEVVEIVEEIDEQPAWRAVADKEMDYADGNQLDSALLKRMQESDEAGGLIARAANRHLGKSDREAAGVLKGRKVAPKVQTLVVPGSARVKAQAEAEGLDKVFLAAGAEWRNPG